MPARISRAAYADIYGPTVGDKVRLGDTSLILQVEKDFAVYGDECMFGGGTGPATGTCATTCTPGSHYIRMMLQAVDDLPLNFGFTGKGNTSRPDGLADQIRAGALGLKLHEDWGTTPA